MKAKVLLIGSGGREICLAWKLCQSDHVSELITAPGNGGTARLSASERVGKCSNQISFDSGDNADDLLDVQQKTALWCVKEKVDLVIVGPEQPLAQGIADALQRYDIPCFGPSAAASLIEASKEFSKAFMVRHSIPTARYQAFQNSKSACEHIMSASYPALVVKASGLAAGKGVIVAGSKQEACDAVREMLDNNQFGNAGSTVIIEELLEGEEFSVLCFSDGDHIQVMPPAQDHKRLLDGDLGPNTGGMGAYCPCPQITEETLSFVKEKILQRTINGLKQEGKKYVGVLYAGLMLTSDGPRVLEFNCRFGDPECEVILPLLESDLYQVAMACVHGCLDEISVTWKHDTYAVGVVMVSGGYPGAYPKGKVITGIDEVNRQPNLQVFDAGTKLTTDNATVTSGGRVLVVTGLHSDLATCCSLTYRGVGEIGFEGSFHRRDIAKRGLDFVKSKQGGLTYADSGVSVARGDALVSSIKDLAKESSRAGCSSELGGFGGVFDLSAAGYKHPVLVSGTDGVGTKLLLAQSCNKHSTVGFDLVAMCVNDILTHNAEPLYFLDYYACGKLFLGVAEEAIGGIVRACKAAGCSLLGGETAEMPGMYSSTHYDLAGFAVGAYERGRDVPLPRVDQVAPGDVVIGLSSTGLHSNGFSLVRKVLDKCGFKLDQPSPFDATTTLGDCLLTPTAIYSRALLPILRSCPGIRCVAHITGGGIVGNLPRVLPHTVTAILDADQWTVPPVFGWLAAEGDISADEMLSTFNCGLGMCLVVDQLDADQILSQCQNALNSLQLIATKVGHIACREAGGDSRPVVIQNAKNAFEYALSKPKVMNGGPNHVECNGGHQSPPPFYRKKVAVLISGTGTNLQSLIDHSMKSSLCPFEITLVISNKSGVMGLTRAQSAGIPTKVINHKLFKNREDFDKAMDAALIEAKVDIVCLAGFMRLLSGWFVQKWKGKVINVHPSLLPAFKGTNAHEQVLQAGVRLTGCTVHFVTTEMDDGAIIAQDSVPVLVGDTVEILQERVKRTEHQVYPRALELVAHDQALFDSVNNKVDWRSTVKSAM